MRHALLMAMALGAACGDAAGPAPVSPREAVDLDPADSVVHVALRAAPATVTIAGERVAALAFDGQVPGPTIRARVGDTIVVDIDNAMDQPTTVHWHGVHVPWAMDGITWQAAPIAPGARFTATFVADRPGVFWYHPHFDSAREVDRGLYGALIVEDPAEPAVDQEVVLVFDTWGEDVDVDVDARGMGGAEEDHAHGVGIDDRMRQWIVNGLDHPRLTVRGGTTVRARLVNASNTGYLAFPVGAAMTVIGHDQGLASAPDAGLGPDGRLVLAPGDRADVVWRVGMDDLTLSTERYTLNGGAASDPMGAVPLVDLIVTAPAAPPAPLAWPFDPRAPSPDPGTTDVLWVLEGSDHGWLMNGESFPDVTIPEVALGQDVVIEVRNLSPTHHPFHLHGMPFEVLSQDGVAPAARDLEDTLDLPIRGRARLLVHADNPGDWLAHCHILPHAHGMMSILRVTAPTERGPCSEVTAADALRFEGYLPRAWDIVGMDVVDGSLRLRVERWTDAAGQDLDAPVEETFAVTRPDGGPVPAAPDRPVSLTLPVARGLVTRFTGAASFPAGLCVLGSDGDDAVEVRVAGPLEVRAGAGQDVVMVTAARALVDGGDGHDTIEVADAGAGHVVHGGAGRDRLVVGGRDARVYGDGDDDGLVAVESASAALDGGDGIDRTPQPLDDAATRIERGGLANSGEAYRWCGPLAAPTPGDDTWDPAARQIEDLLLAEIDAARAAGLECAGVALPPAAVAAHDDPDVARLRWEGRMHMRDVGGYPPPTSPRFADDAVRNTDIFPDMRDAHTSRDGDDYYLRAFRAGVDLGPITTRVFENVTRCVNTEPGCTSDAATIAHRLFEEWHQSEAHCRTLMAFPDAPARYAVGVFRQFDTALGGRLDQPHIDATFEIVAPPPAALH